jgi:hypothetical protein
MAAKRAWAKSVQEVQHTGHHAILRVGRGATNTHDTHRPTPSVPDPSPACPLALRAYKRVMSLFASENLPGRPTYIRTAEPLRSEGSGGYRHFWRSLGNKSPSRYLDHMQPLDEGDSVENVRKDLLEALLDGGTPMESIFKRAHMAHQLEKHTVEEALAGILGRKPSRARLNAVWGVMNVDAERPVTVGDLQRCIASGSLPQVTPSASSPTPSRRLMRSPSSPTWASLIAASDTKSASSSPTAASSPQPATATRPLSASAAGARAARAEALLLSSSEAHLLRASNGALRQQRHRALLRTYDSRWHEELATEAEQMVPVGKPRRTTSPRLTDRPPPKPWPPDHQAHLQTSAGVAAAPRAAAAAAAAAQDSSSTPLRPTSPLCCAVSPPMTPPTVPPSTSYGAAAFSSSPRWRTTLEATSASSSPLAHPSSVPHPRPPQPPSAVSPLSFGNPSLQVDTGGGVGALGGHPGFVFSPSHARRKGLRRPASSPGIDAAKLQRVLGKGDRLTSSVKAGGFYRWACKQNLSTGAIMRIEVPGGSPTDRGRDAISEEANAKARQAVVDEAENVADEARANSHATSRAKVACEAHVEEAKGGLKRTEAAKAQASLAAKAAKAAKVPKMVEAAADRARALIKANAVLSGATKIAKQRKAQQMVEEAEKGVRLATAQVSRAKAQAQAAVDQAKHAAARAAEEASATSAAVENASAAAVQAAQKAEAAEVAAAESADLLLQRERAVAAMSPPEAMPGTVDYAVEAASRVGVTEQVAASAEAASEAATAARAVANKTEAIVAAARAELVASADHVCEEAAAFVQAAEATLRNTVKAETAAREAEARERKAAEIVSGEVAGNKWERLYMGLSAGGALRRTISPSRSPTRTSTEDSQPQEDDAPAPQAQLVVDKSAADCS